MMVHAAKNKVLDHVAVVFVLFLNAEKIKGRSQNLGTYLWPCLCVCFARMQSRENERKVTEFGHLLGSTLLVVGLLRHSVVQRK